MTHHLPRSECLYLHQVSKSSKSLINFISLAMIREFHNLHYLHHKLHHFPLLKFHHLLFHKPHPLHKFSHHHHYRWLFFANIQDSPISLQAPLHDLLKNPNKFSPTYIYEESKTTEDDIKVFREIYN